MSQREFDREFGSFEDCFLATVQTGLSLLGRTLVEVTREEKQWLARVRSAVVTTLRFLDAQPGWARILVVETPSAGPRAVACREEALARLAELLERGSPCTETGGELTLQRGLVAELVIGGALAVIHNRLVKHQGMPLAELAPSLMSMIVLPYLGQQAASRELQRSYARSAGSSVATSEPPARTTYRTALVLRAIGGTPNASNREVAAAAGVIDEGQTSRLLARLQRQGLIENVGLGHAYGEPNAWLLTPTGKRVAELSLPELTPADRVAASVRDSGRPSCQGGSHERP